MKNEKNIVYLFHPIKGLRPFGAEHAANIMAIPENIRGGWSWPPEKEKVDEKSPVNADDSTGSGTDQERKQRKDRDKPGD